ncbi:hypothetical protein LMG28140_02087 [Paraburkholderia metrosideri]|jgi:hypothetical protein|uniref:Uncharacterized protein n=1 Tax=Paraburkholderia metrosideri TaxID=580937 RepID=A0ABM8NJC0_9BURK|nr:hypothetical protein LMG28140_02087 [Paraburkholderia metrosideri]
MTTGCKAADVKRRLWHRGGNKCCCSGTFSELAAGSLAGLAANYAHRMRAKKMASRLCAGSPPHAAMRIGQPLNATR